jgi:hypothetical protein
MPAALDGAIPSLQAWHEKQRLLFFAELLIQLHCWHCHEATRAEADLSVLSIPLRIGSGGSDGVKAAEVNLGREDSMSLFCLLGPPKCNNFLE